MAMRRIEVVGAVITDSDGRVLAARRSARMPLHGRWEFPGGKVEPGEAPAAALVREIREELGCEIAVGDRVTTTEDPQGERLIVLTTYWCRLAAGTPTALEHAELRWVAASELDDLDWALADVPAVRQVMRALARQRPSR